MRTITEREEVIASCPVPAQNRQNIEGSLDKRHESRTPVLAVGYKHSAGWDNNALPYEMLAVSLNETVSCLPGLNQIWRDECQHPPVLQRIWLAADAGLTSLMTARASRGTLSELFGRFFGSLNLPYELSYLGSSLLGKT